MDNTKFVGTFHSEEDAIRKIRELQTQGYESNDIYAVARDEDQISMVRGRTDVDVQSAEGGWIDRFMAFLSGEEPVRAALEKMDLPPVDEERYVNEINDGAILVYGDKQFGQRFESNDYATEADVNLGPDPLDRTSPGYLEEETVIENEAGKLDELVNGRREDRHVDPNDRDRFTAYGESAAAVDATFTEDRVVRPDRIDQPPFENETYARDEQKDLYNVNRIDRNEKVDHQLEDPLLTSDIGVRDPLVSPDIERQMYDNDTAVQNRSRSELGSGGTSYDAMDHAEGIGRENHLRNESRISPTGLEGTTLDIDGTQQEHRDEHLEKDQKLLSTEDELRETVNDELKKEDNNPYTDKSGRRL